MCHQRSPDAMVNMALAPCSPFQSRKTFMKESAQLAQDLDVRLHTHIR